MIVAKIFIIGFVLKTLLVCYVCIYKRKYFDKAVNFLKTSKKKILTLAKKATKS